MSESLIEGALYEVTAFLQWHVRDNRVRKVSPGDLIILISRDGNKFFHVEAMGKFVVGAHFEQLPSCLRLISKP
jgi:hypothetical protein